MRTWIELARRRTPLLVVAAALALLSTVIAYRLVEGDGDGADGAPGAMSTPLTLEELRRRAEAAPGEAEGWQRLGFAYFEASQFAEAAAAYRKAVDAAPQSAVLWSSLGEALVMASERELLPPPAREAFRRAAGIDSGDPRARYFLAVEKDLAGQHEGAIADWLALLADTPPGAPWEADLVRTIEQVGAINAIAVEPRIAQASAQRDLLPAPALRAIPGPTQEQMAAASAMTPTQQQSMAEDMVGRLAARLDDEPGDVEGWIMLMRSYQTLGREEAARQALARAKSENPAAGRQLSEAAAMLGL